MTIETNLNPFAGLDPEEIEDAIYELEDLEASYIFHIALAPPTAKKAPLRAALAEVRSDLANLKAQRVTA